MSSLVAPTSFRGGIRSHETAPLVSVIVVVFRDRAELEQLIDNLEAFRGPDLEVVIVDGGSQDGSLELLQSRSGEIDSWLSEPDAGLFEAMNKGVQHSRGEFLLHINAGDRLWRVPFDALRAAAPDTAAVAGRIETDTGVIGIPYFDGRLKRSCTIHHQATFYRRSMHLGYDTSLRMAADFDLNQRMLLAGMKVELRDERIALHSDGGVSDDSQHFHENLAVVRKNFGWWQMMRSRFERTYGWKLYRRARVVGPVQVFRSARRQLGQKLKGDPPPSQE